MDDVFQNLMNKVLAQKEEDDTALKSQLGRMYPVTQDEYDAAEEALGRSSGVVKMMGYELVVADSIDNIYQQLEDTGGYLVKRTSDGYTIEYNTKS